MKSTISAEQLEHVTDHENEHWSRVFKDEKKKITEERKLYSSYWWEDYYRQINSIIKSTIKPNSRILELGSGSGKATLLLGDNYKKHLFDISPPAIEFARYLSSQLKAKKVEFSIGNGFDTKLKPKSYDYVWNIGVIEHYTGTQATAFIAEMIRLTRDDGYIGVAVPNFSSYHIWKANILNKPLFKKIPGYRLDSENEYKFVDVKKFIKNAASIQGRKIVTTESFMLGNPLPMGSSKAIINTIGKPINSLLKSKRFLLLVIVKIGKT